MKHLLRMEISSIVDSKLHNVGMPSFDTITLVVLKIRTQRRYGVLYRQPISTRELGPDNARHQGLIGWPLRRRIWIMVEVSYYEALVPRQRYGTDGVQRYSTLKERALLYLWHI